MKVNMPAAHARLLAVTVVAVTAIISVAAVMISRSGAERSDERDEARTAFQALAARQALRAQDSEAKSRARNAVSEVESCFVTVMTYEGCGESALQALGRTALEIRDASESGYTVAARSLSGTVFTFAKRSDGTYERTCDAPGKGGCEPGGTW